MSLVSVSVSPQDNFMESAYLFDDDGTQVSWMVELQLLPHMYASGLSDWFFLTVVCLSTQKLG